MEEVIGDKGLPAKQIIDDIRQFILGCGGALEEWYVGRTWNPRKRLFAHHNVSERFDAWIYRHALSSEDARFIEQTFLSAGCIGGTSSINDEAKFVFVYRATEVTQQWLTR